MTETRKSWLRLLYAKTLRYFGTALAVCALIGGLFGDQLHFVFALCAVGGLALVWGWFTFLRADGMRLPGFGRMRETKKVPFFHQREKRLFRPSFAMKNEDFDDDLNLATTLREDQFDERLQNRARWLSRMLCGALLIGVSFLIYR